MQPKYFDSILQIPAIPFVIELPTVCFKVHYLLCKAARNEYLRYFELIPGFGYYRAVGFMVDNEKFTVLSKDGWALDYLPPGFSCERETAIDNPFHSLRNNPATGLDAFAIYATFLDRLRDERFAEIIADLNNDRVTAANIKKRFPDLLDYKHPLIHELRAAIVNQVWRGSVIKSRSSKGTIKNPDLLESYRFYLDRQTVSNKSEAAREAAKLFYPTETDDYINDIANKLLDSTRKT